MRVRATAAVLGAVFGFSITWGQFSDPDRIREMLLLEDAYLYLMMATAVGLAFVGIRLLRRYRAKALVTGTPIVTETARPGPEHLAGAAIFGVGWALADACPAPIAAQLTPGLAWSLFTLAGMGIGIALYLRLRFGPARGREPAPPPAAAASRG